MKQGQLWYQREPVAFLGGIQGLTERQIAVYTIIIDLMYQHGGTVNNDPAWFAGWIKGVGATGVRNTISELVGMGKLIVNGDQLTNHKAAEISETKRKQSENAKVAGRLGGVSTKYSGAGSNENKGLSQPSRVEKNIKTLSRDQKVMPLFGEDQKKPVEKPVDRFQEFWDNAYPHRGGAKRGRKKSRQKWDAAIKRGVDQGLIIDRAKAFCADKKVMDGFAPDPATWLNGDGWEDEVQRQFAYKSKGPVGVDRSRLTLVADQMVKQGSNWTVGGRFVDDRDLEQIYKLGLAPDKIGKPDA